MTNGDGSRGWVLLAEDDEPSRRSMEELLTGEGFRVDAVSDGAQAVQFLHESQRRGRLPEVLVTDLDMPNFSGADLITVLRNDPNYQGLAIVVLSSFDRGALPLFQVERMLAKPVRTDTLVRVVSELVELRRQP